MARRRFWFADRFAPDEIGGLMGWPVGTPQLPSVQIGTSPRRMPSREIPRSGRVFGDATWPGAERPIAQPIAGALSHSLVVGPTGSGKSTLLANLVVQDLVAGRGLVLVDGKGDTVESVLQRVPEARRSDVMVLDCADDRPLMGLVTLRGVHALGLHEPLVSADQFQRVQDMLASRQLSGDRSHKHEHYLKGTVFCGGCGARLVFSPVRGNGGKYEYFRCFGRHNRRSSCQAPHYAARTIEDAVLRHHASRLWLTPDEADEVRTRVREQLQAKSRVAEDEVHRAQARLAELKLEQQRLLQLSYRGLVDDEVLAVTV